MGKKLRMISAILLSILLVILAACQRQASQEDELKLPSITVPNGKMLHVKQVVEFYDAEGTPFPRYFELYVSCKENTALELDSEGNVIQIYRDTGSKHFSYDPESKYAVEYPASAIFSINPSDLADYGMAQAAGGVPYQYSGRNCTAYMLPGKDQSDDIRMYVDDETGFVLFCDAPLFCVKTAGIEVLPYDAEYFVVPDDLIFDR